MANRINEIEDYVEGKMDADMREQFEQRMHSDPTLKAAVEAQTRLFQHLEYLFAEKKVSEAISRPLATLPTTSTRIWLLLSLLIFVLAGFWYINRMVVRPSSPEQVPPAAAPARDAASVPDKPMATAVPPVTAPATPPKSPIAGVATRPDPVTTPVYRDLPEKGLPEVSKQFFSQHFHPLLPFEANSRWKAPADALIKGQPKKTIAALNALPAALLGNDTTQYLRTTALLMLHQPAIAEAELYALENHAVWRQEVRRMIVWALVLQGKDELAAATLRLLPDDFQDKQLLQQYLEAD